MIPRLDCTTTRKGMGLEWPATPRESPHLFSARSPFRKIVVMIDAALVDEDVSDQEPCTKEQVLSVLLESELVQLHRYADGGPPESVSPAKAHTRAYKGWVVVVGHGPIRGRDVVYESSPGVFALGGVTGNKVDRAEQDAGSDVYKGHSPEEATSRCRDDRLAAEVAVQVLGADMYVTERPYLHAAWRPYGWGVLVSRVDEALALLALYFRAQGQFVLGPNVLANRGLFFWVGTRELLSESWRWFGACIRSADGNPDDSLVLLAGSLLQRVQRALEARDAIHLALNQPQDHDTQQQALSYLDVVLVFLMGAVDVAARVAHRILDLPSKEERRAGWQHDAWVKKLKMKAPALAAVVDADTAAAHGLTILRLLRNSVHGETLQGLAVGDPRVSIESVIALPASDQSEVLGAMDALGGQAAWGARDVLPSRVHLDPGLFVDRLFVQTLRTINDLMANTPVDKLLSEPLTASETECPVDGPFQPWVRRSIRWQLGFDDSI